MKANKNGSTERKSIKIYKIKMQAHSKLKIMETYCRKMIAHTKCKLMKI